MTPKPLYATSHSWPFASWGVDIVGSFKKATTQEYKYILPITDYFSKWAKVIVVKDFVSTMVVEFIRVHIIYQFGVPKSIAT